MRSLLFIPKSCLTAVACVLLAVPATLEAQVTLLTVGPHGTYSRIQDAIDAAITGEQTEICVEGAHTYYENLRITGALSSGTLSLLGGWNSEFTERVFLPEDTIIDGQLGDRVLDAFGPAGDLLIDGFTFTNGLMGGPGGGMRIDPSGNSRVTLSNIRIIGNSASGPGGNSGGGLEVELFNSQRLELINCTITENVAASTGNGIVVGGGVNLRAIGDSTFLIQNCDIDRNVIDTGGQVFGAGVRLESSDNARGELLDTAIVANGAIATDVWAAGAYFETRGESTLIVERSVVGLNPVDGDTAPQLWISAGGLSSIEMRDSLFGLGEEDGVDIDADNHSVVNLTNLTVADNLGVGIDLSQIDLATITLYNTISYGSTVDLVTSGTVDVGFNLIGVDPRFVDPATYDYHLGPGSPAEDAGTDKPPGGLGLIDLDGNSRILGSAVDIGCYEGIGVIFASDFETGDASTWSGIMP